MSRQEKTPGAAGGVADGLVGTRLNDLHDPLDQGARREVLPGPRLCVLGVLLQEPFVGIALHVGAQRRPVFLVDQVDDQTTQLGGVLDFILGLVEDQPKQALFVAQGFKGMAVVIEEVVAVSL